MVFARFRKKCVLRHTEDSRDNTASRAATLNGLTTRMQVV